MEILVGHHIVTDIPTLLIYHSTFFLQKSVKDYSKEHSNYTDKYSHIYQGGVSDLAHTRIILTNHLTSSITVNPIPGPKPPNKTSLGLVAGFTKTQQWGAPKTKHK